MVKALVDLTEHENRVLNIVKGKFGLRNKTDAIRFLIGEYENAFLSPELRPEYSVGGRDLIERKREGMRRFEEFERTLARRGGADPAGNFKLFKKLLEEARKLGKFPPSDPLEGIDLKIKIARVVNHG